MSKRKSDQASKTVAMTLALAVPAVLAAGSVNAAVPANPDQQQVSVQQDGTPVLSQSSKMQVAAHRSSKRATRQK